jgi:predicted transcriptional regulator of viral defense system
VTIDSQNITPKSLGRLDSIFLTKVGSLTSFSSADARKFLGKEQDQGVRQFLDRLQKKGWIRRIKGGRFAVVPLSSGESRSVQLHEFVVAMTLVQPAAIAYLSAMSHHGFTEQLPRTVFVATDHRIAKRSVQTLGLSFKIVCVSKKKYFGLTKEWIDEQPVMITDREKTIIDGLDLPENVGGIGSVTTALKQCWDQLDEGKLQHYAVKMGNSAVATRLGFLMETLDLGDAEVLLPVAKRGSGYSRLDPTLPARGKHNRMWGLLINAEVEG